ncbi:MAG: excinuclease ABC subunit C [Paludibacteraceae bacterium]|nr:excinuclease ABC subunit C [Paludibacteraceae bacterium]
MDSTTHIKQLISALPELPGVYQFFNSENRIIYVGKAKNLKKRVSSYFNKTSDSLKTNALVKQICDLKYIVVGSENEALLLENNLIKQYQPRYNVLLKDGKSYPSICITKEMFPRVFKTRNIVRDGSEYFGPYSSNYALNLLLEIIHELYPLRTCKLSLTRDSIEKKKFQVCLQYHIHKCNGVCEAKESVQQYQKYIDDIRQILRGNAHEISKILFEEMQLLASELRFEEAQKVKEKLNLIEDFRSKTVVVNVAVRQTDVYGYIDDEANAYITILRVNNGSIVQGQTIEYKKRLNESKEELLAFGILELSERLNSTSKNIIVPFLPEKFDENLQFHIPQRGDQKKLLDLAMQNVKQYKLDRLKQAEKLNPDQRMVRILGALQKLLQLKEMPLHIECFDNSNLSGSDAVAACVVFRKAKPSKKEYRKFTIKTVEGADDYASMREVVGRRYSRMLEENQSLPNLIIADGGVGQMEAIRQVVEDELNLSIPIAGLVKNDKHRTNELLFGFPPKSVGLKITDETFKFLTQIQDEVHRFAISFHRNKRSKSQIKSELDNVKGIGESSKKELIKHFKSLKRAKEADFSDLEKVLGKHKATILYEYFHPKNK